MSVFITDNMGLDTTDIPLKMFSESELLTVQNKYDEAFQKLDSIILVYPEHGLEDDVKYQKANLYLKLRDYQKALDLYTDIYTNYVEEIRADNSLFAAAEINEFYLEDLDRAKELYEKLFIDFSNSTYAVEARKRYRRLRGDNLQ
jgi:TolA-binding protein